MMTKNISPPKLGNLSIEMTYSRKLAPFIVREEAVFVVGMKKTSS
jgi:hypothetical protein